MKAPSPFDLTAKEQSHVRAALQFLRRRAGGIRPLAKALHMPPTTLANIMSNHKVMPSAAFKVARFAKVSMDDLLAGQFPAPGTCPYCGHVKGNPSE